jgi:hypothetical protein
MCATVSWGAHESFMHPIFVLKNGCDKKTVMYLVSYICWTKLSRHRLTFVFVMD